MNIGYARVSTTEQVLDYQVSALVAAGCQEDKIYTDKVTGSKMDRPGLTAALAYIRPGDTLVVWRLDRLGRTMAELISLVGNLQAKGIHFRSLTENIDTSTATGQLVFHLFASLAEFERNLTRERTKAALDEARARGRKGGRPTAMDESQEDLALKLHESKEYTIDQICQMLGGISDVTLYRHLPKARARRAAKETATNTTTAMPTPEPTVPNPAMPPEPQDRAKLYLARRAAFALAAKEARNKGETLNVAAHMNAAEGEK